VTDITTSIPHERFWFSLFLGFSIAIAGGILFPLSLSVSLPAIGLIGVIAHGILFKTIPQIPKLLLAFFALTIILTGLSTTWSITPDESHERWIKTSLLLFGLFLFITITKDIPAPIIQRYKYYLIAPLIITGTILALQFLFNIGFYLAPYFNIDPSTIQAHLFNKNVALLIICLPSIVYILLKSKQTLALTAISIMTIFILWKTDSAASQLAFVIMIFLAFGLFKFWEQATRFLMFSSLIILALLMPFIASILFDLSETLDLQQSLIPATGLMRFENWDFISREVLKLPLLGHGMDTARAMTFTTDQIFYPGNKIMHPHNIFLQIWLEYGALGAGLMAICLGVYAHHIKDRLHIVVFGGAVAILLLSWSIWSAWFIAALSAAHVLTILAVKSKTAPMIS
jgi:O-antigen ligase